MLYYPFSSPLSLPVLLLAIKQRVPIYVLPQRFEVSIVHSMRCLADLIRAKTYRDSIVAITSFAFVIALIINFHDSVVVVLYFVLVDHLITSSLIVLR